MVAATLGGAAWHCLVARDPAAAPGRGCPISTGVLPAAREFGATLTFAGVPGKVTRTLPLETYPQRVTDLDAAVALSPLLVVVAALVVLGAGALHADRTDTR